MTEPVIQVVRPQGARPQDMYIVGDSYFAVSRENAARLICLKWRRSEHDANLALDKASAKSQLRIEQSYDGTKSPPEGSDFV